MILCQVPTTMRLADKNKVFFTSDPHFFHAKIIEYCNRPFSSASEMNEAMVERWNEKVPKDGVVFIVGDVSFAKADETVKILKRLNGRKVLITGNHDRHLISNPANSELRSCFSSIHDLLDLRVDDKERDDGKTDFVLSHYAMRVWNKSHHGAIQLYGHSHGTLPPIGLQMDVGVDGNNFSPYSYDEVLVKLWKTRGSFKTVVAEFLVSVATWILK